jgi:hypothetical protein
MADKSPEQKSGPEKPALDDQIQHHLGDELRAAYNALAPKPAYLGDRALPAEFEHQLLRMEATLEVREKGIDAVREALAIPDDPADGDKSQR